VCRDKATCLKNVLCGSDACGNRCGTCVDSCGSAAVCSRDNAQTCPATCDGALCSDKCTPCAKGCNVKTGACF